MDWKKFLKPDWRKIVITILLMILPTIFIKAYTTVLHSCPVGMTDCPPLFDWELFLQMIVIALIITYSISCFLVWIYDKVKKKKR
jgi:hypothetical protein